MPNRTKTVAARSISDRGRKAESIPMGNAISIQRIAPPKTSEAVTGAASRIVCVTSRRFVNGASRATGRSRGAAGTCAYWIGTGRSRPSRCDAFGDARLRRALPAGEPGRVRGDDVEDHVRHHRHGDEEHDGPEKTPDQVTEHECGSLAQWGDCGLAVGLCWGCDRAGEGRRSAGPHLCAELEFDRYLMNTVA